MKQPVEALRDVSFDVREGEIFGLIGRNGAGKTTLTKIVATLVQPTSGTVTVKGYDSVREDERVRAQVGLATAEERSFYWRLTAEQNLLFFARLYGLDEAQARQRISELLERFEIEELRARRFAELSTGNRQRLAMARAMLTRPQVLLLDEPTRSLDPLAAARARSLIGSLARQDPPVSVLLTSHNLTEIEELCERVAVISRGQIRALDTPERLRTLHTPTERIHIFAKEISVANAKNLFLQKFDEMEITEKTGTLSLSFTRKIQDNRLNEVIRVLRDAGAEIVSFDVERATLLDVMESYEREDEVKAV
ncbi:MAG TPA: ABC transporter ATP-binding protein [Pyrinomonadaceae bacterium]|nr:ABC transporter ATP-binding protein [Pyrinomonadaceae bacterium]